mgnify:CR=1 FL=1
MEYTIEIKNEEIWTNDIICLNLTTLRDIGSVGAKHYYWKLKLPKVNYKCDSGNVSGLKEHNLLREIELNRKLTQEEIDLGEERFRAHEVEGWFNGFNSEKEVDEFAKLIEKINALQDNAPFIKEAQKKASLRNCQEQILHHLEQIVES